MANSTDVVPTDRTIINEVADLRTISKNDQTLVVYGLCMCLSDDHYKRETVETREKISHVEQLKRCTHNLYDGHR